MSTPGIVRKNISVWKEVFLLGLLLFGIGWVHGFFLREGHGWGDDFAQYLMHAKNLAEGRPYSQTGYIYNPHYPQLGPPAYPPGTAVLLAPVYWVWGLNWAALKGAMIACWIAFLAILAMYFRQVLFLPVRFLLLALIGLNHFFLDQTNTIGSDLPFLVWVYFTLFLAEQADRAEPQPYPRQRTDGEPFQDHLPQAGADALPHDLQQAEARNLPGPAVWHWAAAWAAWAAFATRTVGLILWPAILLAHWFRYRRIRPSLVWATGLFGLLAAAQTLAIPETSGYLDQFSVHPGVWVRHTVQYARQWAAFWGNDFSKLLTGTLAICVSGLALMGYCRQCRKGVSVREIFAILYGASVVIWPSYQGFRMLDPLMPLGLFYAWKGLEPTGQNRWGRIRLAGAAGLAGAILLCYGNLLLSRPTGPLPEGIGRPASQQLFEAVRQHTQREDVLIFIKPRALALLTSRRCSVYHRVQEDGDLWAYFQKIHATSMVVVRRPETMQGAEDLETVRFLAHFAARNQPYLQHIWANEDFALYRIASWPGHQETISRRPLQQ